MKPREFIRKSVGIIMVNSSDGSGMTDSIMEYFRKWVLGKKKEIIGDMFLTKAYNQALEDIAKELK